MFMLIQGFGFTFHTGFSHNSARKQGVRILNFIIKNPKTEHQTPAPAPLHAGQVKKGAFLVETND